MSSIKVKTTYSVEGPYGSTETKTLYCVHGSFSMSYYDENGDSIAMFFQEWESGNDLWDAMLRLSFPFKDEWFGPLKENVEYYK